MKISGLLEPAPPAVETVTYPVVAPAGTVAVIEIAELTVTLVAAVPLKLTDVPPMTKFAPAIAMDWPTAPTAGVKLVIVGT